MNSFRTDIKLKPIDLNFTHGKSIFCIGSCFTEHIHTKLNLSGFQSLCNPCGIVYNPVSIQNQIFRLLTNQPWNENDLILHNELYHGLYHHGSFSDNDKMKVLDKMNLNTQLVNNHLLSASFMLVTFGTSIVYTLKEKNIIVANAHKIPAHAFTRRFLELNEIVHSTREWINLVKDIHPDCQFIFTVSPVRYLKEGFTDNTRSKALLHLAIEEITKSMESVHYFPAYEIILDDLRDYRFYKEDMIHPSDQAIEYVWKCFKETFFSSETHTLSEKVFNLNKSLNHKPLHEHTIAHQSFMKNLHIEIELLKKKHPEILFRN